MWNYSSVKTVKKCTIVTGTAANQVPEFKTTDTKLYIPVVTLSNQDNVKLLKQLEPGFKRTINWNKCQSKETEQAQNKYLGFFQGVNRFFVLWFKDENGRVCYKQYYLPTGKFFRSRNRK